MSAFDSVIRSKILLTCCSFALCATAQPDDTKPPNLVIAYTQTGNSDFGRIPNAEIEVRDHHLAFQFLRAGSDGHTFDFGVDYQYTHFDFEGVDSRDRDQHRLQFPIHFEISDDDRFFEGFIAPGVSTSSNIFKDPLNRLTGKDMFFSGRLQVRSGDSNHWFAGIAHDRTFGESATYPVAGVELNRSSGWQMRIAFPDPSVRFAISDRQALAIELIPSGHQWRVVTDDFSDEFRYRLEGWRGQLTWTAPLWRSLGFFLAGGYEFNRHQRFDDASGSRVISDIDDAWFLSAGLRLGGARVPRPHAVDW